LTINESMKHNSTPDDHDQPPHLALTLTRSLLEGFGVFAATTLVLVVIILSVALLVPMVVVSPLLFLALAVGLPIGGVYRLVLMRVYLKGKLTPIFAGAAVALCTAMVIVVISVMGGFLNMMRQSARKLSAEVTIKGDLTGFEHYEALMIELLKEDQIDIATPVVRVPGLLDLDGSVQPIPQVIGIIPADYGQVCGFDQMLHWTLDDAADFEFAQALIERSRTLEPPSELDQMSGMIPGIHVWPNNKRDDKGSYEFLNSSVTRSAKLTVVPLTKLGSPLEKPNASQFVVLNEFKSGLYEMDSSFVFVRFEVLQQMLRMGPRRAEEIDKEFGLPTGKIIDVPGRAHEVAIGGAEGVSTKELAEAAQRALRRFAEAEDQPVAAYVLTWKQRYKTLLGAVEKEKGLLTVLFCFISIVAVVLVAVIFYMIVAGKTRDIGTLRALGASRSGIASIFVGYGLAVGAIGAILGTLLATAIVLNLNEIQDLLFQWFGFKMWDPQVYYFERIPTHMNLLEVAAIVVAAILSSLFGAAVPAMLAARANPVDALRYE
jgi:lipoprotein-releasing system permease protein